MRVHFQLHKQLKFACLILIAITAAKTSTSHAQQPVATSVEAPAKAEQQLKFEYLFFWKDNDSQTKSVLDATQQELGKLGNNVSLKQIGIKESANAEAVAFYGVSRAPMPLVLCTASNGAVTKAFVSPFPATQLRDGIVSRGTAESLKALQDNKLVVLCALNGESPVNHSVLNNAKALKADERFGNAVEVIALDVHDQNEASLLAGMKLDASMAQPTIVILAPPGNQLATLTGAVTTEQIAEKLLAAQSTCCPGGQCGPAGQCCPGGQCPPQKK